MPEVNDGYQNSEFSTTVLAMIDALVEDGVPQELIEECVERAVQIAEPIIGKPETHIAAGRGKEMSEVADLLIIGILMHSFLAVAAAE
jgi:hypothetical protein